MRRAGGHAVRAQCVLAEATSSLRNDLCSPIALLSSEGAALVRSPIHVRREHLQIATLRRGPKVN